MLGSWLWWNSFTHLALTAKQQIRRFESNVMSASTNTESKFLRACDFPVMSMFSRLTSSFSFTNRLTWDHGNSCGCDCWSLVDVVVFLFFLLLLLLLLLWLPDIQNTTSPKNSLPRCQKEQEHHLYYATDLGTGCWEDIACKVATLNRLSSIADVVSMGPPAIEK